MMILSDFSQWLATHSALINLTTSVILATATTIYVIFTVKLVRETRKARIQALTPHIVAFLDAGECTPTNRYIIIENIGAGSAIDVRFEIKNDIDYTNTPSLNTIPFMKNGANYFPGKKRYKFFLTNTENKPENDYIEFIVKYTDAMKNEYNERFKLVLNDNIIGDGKLTPPDSYVGMISHNLNKINTTLVNLVKKD
jgi:hypothetical protein